jgi:C-terminal processing protease CtpA/Prc
MKIYRICIFKIANVTAHSPAYDAGFHNDDVIESINGKSASEYTIDDLYHMFIQERKEYKIKIKRGEEMLLLLLKNRRQI